MYIPSKNISWQKLDNEIYIVDERLGKVYGLNGTGSIIWNYILKHISDEDYSSLISKKFNIDIYKVKADSKIFIKNMISKGFLVEVNNDETS